MPLRSENLSGPTQIVGSRSLRTLPTHTLGDKKRRRRWGTRISRVAQALLIAAVVCVSLGATDPGARFNKIGGKLMCTCGCAQSLLGCGHYGCPNRGGEMDELRDGIANGQS